MKTKKKKGTRKSVQENSPSKDELCRELIQYEQAGVSLWLNGHESDPYSIAKACMTKENHGYMRDYYTNAQNEIYGIDFNKV